MMPNQPKISSYPNLLSEWDWEMNDLIGIQPEGISLGSVKKVYWKCKFGHEWQASISNRSKGRGCPMCARRATTKSKEKEIFQYSSCGNYIKMFNSIKETGILQSKISACCREKSKTADG